MSFRIKPIFWSDNLSAGGFQNLQHESIRNRVFCMQAAACNKEKCEKNERFHIFVERQR